MAGLKGTFGTIAGALNGHTTSGLDAAMQAHADQLHPVSATATKITESTAKFPDKPVTKPAGGWPLQLPSDK